MAGSKPGERRGGRQKGTPNVLPDLRAITLKALMKAGGVEYLVRQADENPLGFMSLLGRVMPREAHVELSGEVKLRQEVRRDLVDKVIVLMQAPVIPRADDESEKPAIDGTATPLPALTHNPDAMLKAQRNSDAGKLSRRAENARREAVNTVGHVVQRASNAQQEGLQRRSGIMSYEREAIERIDGLSARRQSTPESSSESAETETAGISEGSSLRMPTPGRRTA